MDLFLRARQHPKEERGAVAVIVALSLIALMGMIVLTVDVGGLLYRRRQMVSASDAAALAAAQSCALGSTKAGVPETQADTFAGDNLSGITLIGGIVASETVGCETARNGHVTVQYSSVQNLWFAGIFGQSQNDVVTKATAEWGASGSANPIPFIVTMHDFGNVYCTDPDTGLPVQINPETTPEGANCYVWFDNGSNSGSFGGFGGSVFGSLNLNSWNIGETENCPNKDLDANRDYAYNGGFNGDMDPLNYPDPTWVCIGAGEQDTLYGDNGLKNQEGNILVFPVTDGQVVESSSGQIEKFNVVGFVAFQLVHVYDANEIGGGSGTCVVEQTFAPGQQLALNTVTGNGCPGTSDVIQDLTITSVTDGANRNPTVYQQQVNYTYNALNNTFAWGNNMPPGNVEITFTWSQPGPCGPKPSNASSHCLVVTWQGAQIGNGAIGGVNFGIPAVRLCDLTVINSCGA
jgi:Flp pilus assembly protein TadG